jgi:hypothetical protein
MKISAAFAGERWLPYRRAEERLCSIHSVFDRVINVSAGGELLSVAADGVGGSSSFLIVPGKRLEWGAVPGERCVLGAGRLRAARYAIDFGGAAVWKGPVPRDYKHNGSIKTENVAAFRAVLDRKAASASAWNITGGGGGRFFGLDAIRKLRENTSHAKMLIGLGPGLTPSGDDMLLGFIAITNHVRADLSYIRALRDAVSDALDRTGDISAQALRNAMDRDYHEYVQNCVRDLCEGGPESVYLSAAALAKVGATSGSDIACGMYFGMTR